MARWLPKQLSLPLLHELVSSKLCDGFLCNYGDYTLRELMYWCDLDYPRIPGFRSLRLGCTQNIHLLTLTGLLIT